MESSCISSSDLARISKTKEENVRRDLMLIGCKSISRKRGFSVPVLIEKISEALNLQKQNSLEVVVIGNGECLKEILENHPYHNIVLAGVFDFNYSKPVIKDDISYYPLNMLHEVMEQKKILLAVINISAEYVEQISEILINSGIKGIINYSTVKLKLPPHIYLEEINQLTIIEKAFFNMNRNKN